MNILMTNDDGIDFEWFMPFVEAVRKTGMGDVYVVAPDGNRSGFSHYITFLSAPVRMKKRADRVWACSGAPADCVMMSVLGALDFSVDVVVSGMNRGANLGTDLVYSGTAAAARQAALHHIPAVAFSLDLQYDRAAAYWENAVKYAADHLAEFTALWRDDVFINVNLPNSPSGADGWEMTFPARRNYDADTVKIFDAPDHKRYCFMDGGPAETEPEAGSDCDAVARNKAAVTPVFIHPVAARELCPAAPNHAAAAFRPL
jgi:5'-nucleotidase